MSLGEKNKNKNKKTLYLVVTKWKHHIMRRIKIACSSQIKEKNSITTVNLFPSAGHKRRKRKTKEEKKPQK